jgi:hypothetical protein
MTQAEKIKASQQANLAKFANERDLFKTNPQIAELKEEITENIHWILNQLDSWKTLKDQYKKQLTIVDTRLKKYERKKQLFAQSAYLLQQNGIFWADDHFTVRKPSEPQIDYQAMYNSLSIEDKQKYEIKTTRTVIDTTVDYERLVKEVPIQYTTTHPVIAIKKKKTGDVYDE